MLLCDGVSSSDERVIVAEFLSRDLVKDIVSGVTFASKTKTVITSKRNCAEESDHPLMLLMTFDSKMTFEKHFAQFLVQLPKGLVS